MRKLLLDGLALRPRFRSRWFLHRQRTAAASGALSAERTAFACTTSEHGPKTGGLKATSGLGYMAAAPTYRCHFRRASPLLLARSHRIIAIEEQGHGRTSGRDAPVRFETVS